MPKESIELNDSTLEIQWEDGESKEIVIGVISHEDFVRIHENRGLVVIDSEPFDSLWITIDTKADAIRLVSALKSAMRYLK